ncbi:MAG: hypothetical protein DI616_05665 [Paracoccus denitrificans]|uniref:PH domain-containing protein n=1 Tax=Paracoccus denitrificans TaxID=266 RepID=A0A533IBB8_PARDE|nr:MAG: hypothetical protein DI616_05665 [Paracoccus denitrificans]
MSILDEQIEAHYAPMKLILILCGCVLMLAGSGMLAFGYDGSGPGDLSMFIGWVGLIFFAVCSLLWVRQVSRLGQPAITLSRAGLHDVRLSQRPVPWRAIKGTHIWQQHRQKILVLQVAPAVEPEIGLTRVARLSRGLNAKYGNDGLYVPLTGLKMDADRLASEIDARVRATRSGA